MSPNSSPGSHDEEGEIIETEAEKASLSLPSEAGYRVDRLSSRNRESMSPHPSPHSGYNNDERCPPKSLPNSNSRYPRYSPPSSSRDRGLYSGREEAPSSSTRKRQRSEDSSKSDTRQFRVHYERPPPIDPRSRTRVSYADIDRNDSVEIPKQRQAKEFDERDGYREFKRSRTKSRSPPRAPRGGGGYAGRGDRYYDDRRDRERERERGRDRERERERERQRDRGGYYDDKRGSISRHSRERSVSERGEPPDQSKRDAEDRNKYPGEKKAEPGPSSIRGRNTNGRSVQSVSFRNYVDIWGNSRNGPHDQGKLKPGKEPEQETTKEPEKEEHIIQSEPIDEAKLIEERRKRREAIKAKYKGQSTPLLVSILSINQSMPNSPAVVDSPASGKPEGTASPRETSAPPEQMDISRDDSPTAFDLSKEEEVNGARTRDIQDEDGPSAADYDPTLDMEDKRKRERRFQNGEVSSASYDETRTNMRDVLVPEHIIGETEEEEKLDEDKDDDFDMFAEVDDDEDMFAELPAKPKKPKMDPAKAVPVISQAKQLDASMLDNWDDSEGYYRVILAELLDGRYHVQANLGKGMFSGVVRAKDTKLQKLVAIKIIRNNETM